MHLLYCTYCTEYILKIWFRNAISAMVKVLLYKKLAAVPRAGQIITYNFCNTAPLMSIAYELQYKTTHFLTQTGIYFSVHNIVYMIIYLFFPAIFPGLILSLVFIVVLVPGLSLFLLLALCEEPAVSALSIPYYVSV